MLNIILSALIALFAGGCSGPHYVDYFPYHDDGTVKPRVALIPVIDSSHSGLPWSLSEEITDGLYYQMMDSGALYVLSPPEMGLLWIQRNTIDFFGGDLSFAQNYCNADFIVALELIEHSVTPYDSSLVSSNQYPECLPANRELSMKVRIRIIDVRCDHPRIVLYEVQNTNLMATPPYHDNIDYDKCGWKTDVYPKTPCSLAHQRLIKKIVDRLEQVIWNCK
jgi:hypothetical protein